MSSHDQTASLMTPAKLAQMSAAKPPASPAAFLDQMAADVGHQHIARLKELQPVLGQHARAAHGASLQASIERTQQALQAVDFAPLTQKKGFLAGLTGKSKSAGAEFAARVEHVEQAIKVMTADAVTIGETHRTHSAATDRTLVECEVEYRALDKIIEQGARWLQDMRNQLKARQQQANGDAALLKKVEEDAGRCEVLVTRLKALRAVAAASQQAHQQSQATAQRRIGLALSLQKVGTHELRTWQSTVPPLARFAAEGKSSGSIEDAQEVHQALVKRLGQLLTDCAQLGTDQQAVEQSLAAMGERLAAVS
jgi:hypothetical protein